MKIEKIDIFYQSNMRYNPLGNCNKINFKRNHRCDNYSSSQKTDKQPEKNVFLKFLDCLLGKNQQDTCSDDNQQMSRMEIIRLQQETTEWNKKHQNDNHKTTHVCVSENDNKKAPNADAKTQDTAITTTPPKTTLRTATIVQPMQGTKMLENQGMPIKNIVMPLPNFSFNYKKLIADISKINEVDVNWVEQNPQSVINIFNAASKGAGISQQAIDECYLSAESKANAINQLLSKKEEFLQEAQTQHSFEQQQYVSKVLEYINSIDNQDLIMQALDKIQQYG